MILQHKLFLLSHKNLCHFTRTEQPNKTLQEVSWWSSSLSIKYIPNTISTAMDWTLRMQPVKYKRTIREDAHTTRNALAYWQVFIELANSIEIEYPLAPITTWTRYLWPSCQFTFWAGTIPLFLLKVNKIGQQCKYFYSRKWSQTYRCIAEAKHRGNMVLVS